MAGKGGGAWKVAYADFVTAMMAFFLVMWIVGQNKPVKQAIAGYFRDPLGFQNENGGSGLLPGQASGPPIINLRLSNGSKDPGGSAELAPESSGSDQPEAPHAARPFMIVLHDGQKDSIGTIITFVEDSAELDESGRRRLAELASRVRGKRNKIEIRGHSSLRPLPSGSHYHDVWQLCYARCQATMAFLAEKGVEPDRMRLSQAGGYEPFTHSVEHNADAQNSRVEVYLLGEYVEDLQGTREERDKRVEHAEPREHPLTEAGHAKPADSGHAKPAESGHAKPEPGHAKPEHHEAKH